MDNLTLDEDTIDDLLYFARTADTTELQDVLEQVSRQFNVTPHDILTVAKDANSGNTTLHMAAANGHTEIIKFLLSTWQTGPIPSSFLNAQNNNGNTSLHWAALNGHLQSVQILADAGADLMLKNNAGYDAVYEAELAEKEDVVAWLLKAQGDDEVPEAEQESNDTEGMENETTDGVQPME